MQNNFQINKFESDFICGVIVANVNVNRDFPNEKFCFVKNFRYFSVLLEFIGSERNFMERFINLKIILHDCELVNFCLY